MSTRRRSKRIKTGRESSASAEVAEAVKDATAGDSASDRDDDNDGAVASARGSSAGSGDGEAVMDVEVADDVDVANGGDAGGGGGEGDKDEKQGDMNSNTDNEPTNEDDNNTNNNENEEDDQEEEEEAEEKPKYNVLQRVYAKDQDGILYESVIRRRMYGPHHFKQVQVGLVKSEQELEDLLQQQGEPMWHYFVHYNNWNVNWDRWVEEHDIFELTEKTKKRAKRILQEHRALQKKLKGNRKGPIDGTLFLREWRNVLDQIYKDEEDEEEEEAKRKQQGEENNKDADGEDKDAKMGVDDENNKDNNEAKKDDNNNSPNKKVKRPLGYRAPSRWNKATVEKERKLREKDLEGKREQIHAQKIVLPFSLKKVLVEAWEIITQCQMVPDLPASVTIRHALDQYVESKLEHIAKKSNTNDNENNDNEEDPDKQKKDEDDENDNNNDDTDESNEDKLRNEWMQVSEGIAMFFDEALPFRLIYQQEKPQYQAMMASPKQNNNKKKTKNNAEAVDAVESKEEEDKEEKEEEEEEEEEKVVRMSDIYGCEHLLRLFLKLPEILSETLTDQEIRPILGKVNDFVRFLHKHQATLFAESYRKLNPDEIRQQEKIHRLAERRKRKMEMKEQAEAEAEAEDEDVEDDDDDDDDENSISGNSNGGNSKGGESKSSTRSGGK